MIDHHVNVSVHLECLMTLINISHYAPSKVVILKSLMKHLLLYLHVYIMKIKIILGKFNLCLMSAEIYNLQAR